LAPQHRRRRSSLAASWDPRRFGQTLRFFRGSPWRLLLPPFLKFKDKKAQRPHAAPAASDGDEAVVIDWGLSDGLPVAETWGPLDDVVMGGVSCSSLIAQDGVGGGSGATRRAVFSGTTSKENNGGFCSFRSRLLDPPLDLGGYDGLVFAANCQDGLRYKFQLRDNNGWDTMGWAVCFDLPAGEEEQVRIPFASLVPNFRSYTKSDVPPLQKEAIHSVQLILSVFEFDGEKNPRFKEGAFRLELGPLRAYREAAGP